MTRKLIGERIPWRYTDDIAINEDGDAITFHTAPLGVAVIMTFYREATVAPLVIHFTNWHDGWHEFCKRRDYINGGVEPDEPCWNGFCIAGNHPRSAQHVDATGTTWTQPRKES